MAQQSTPEYSHWLTIATIIFLVWALLFAGVRVWAKVTRSLSWSLSDSFFFAAFIVGIGNCSCIFLAAGNGFGEETPVVGSEVGIGARPGLDKPLYASQILYILATGLSRCSGALFCTGITRSSAQKRPAIAVATICGIWTIACTCAIALRGNLRSPWLMLAGSEKMYPRWLAVETTGLCLEVTIWGLSLALVWGLQMRFLKRVKVMSLFGVRFLVVPIVAGRLYFLDPANRSRSPYATTLSYIFTEAAMQYSLMSECMTCLKPFLQPFYSGYGLSARHNLGYDSNPSREVYTELSNISQSKGGGSSKEAHVSRPSVRTKSVGKQASEPSSRHSSQHRRAATEVEDQLPYRGARSSVIASVEAQIVESRKRRAEDDVELLQQDKLVIQQTTTLDQIEEMAPEVKPSTYT